MLVPPDQLMSTAMQWAQAWPRRWRSIAVIKRSVYLGSDRDLETGLYVAANEMAGVIISEDARTLMNAYNAAVAKDPMAGATNF